MMMCARLSNPTAHPPTLSVRQSTLLPRARNLWSLLPLSVASSWLLSPNDLTITFTSSDDEEEKMEEFSETDIFGTDYSSSGNDIPENNDDDIESSDHDDQEEAQALTAHDDLIAASSVMNDMLDTEHEQVV
jgi:hypothetical protein